MNKGYWKSLLIFVGGGCLIALGIIISVSLNSPSKSPLIFIGLFGVGFLLIFVSSRK